MLRLRPIALAPALALSLALGLAACGGSSSTPQATLRAFLTAWSRRDWPAMKQQVLNPPADFVSVNADALAALGVSSPRFTSGSVKRSGSTATARA